jgi:vacuolar-type H+-ATPase subunit D/Vma8
MQKMENKIYFLGAYQTKSQLQQGLTNYRQIFEIETNRASSTAHLNSILETIKLFEQAINNFDKKSKLVNFTPNQDAIDSFLNEGY